jgi:hypothetical protein
MNGISNIYMLMYYLSDIVSTLKFQRELWFEEQRRGPKYTKKKDDELDLA